MNKTGKYLYFIILGLIFFLAILLRIKTYLLARPLWHDECSLATNILSRDIFGLFKPLENGQKSPAIFMIFTKIVSYFGGIKELSLKFIPLLSGLFSVVIFYFLSKKVLNTKFSLLAANFLFAVNYQLIYWSQKFKHYSFDIFLFMVSALLFSKLDLNKVSYKKCILLASISLLLVLASFPTAFIIGSFIIYCIFSKVNIKKTLLFSLPLILTCFLYYVIFLRPEHRIWMAEYFKYWNEGFLKFNFVGMFVIFRENFNFFFNPNSFALIGFVLFIWGLILGIKDRTQVGKIILLSFLAVALASFLQIYPIWQRSALYLLPVVILFISKPLDLLSYSRKVISAVIIALFLIYFSKYNLSYINSFLKEDAFLKTDALTTFPTLVKEYNNNDILVINSTTKPDFIYYSKIYKFKPHKVILVPIYRYDKEYYYNFLETLPKGYEYWFVFGWEYSHDLKYLPGHIANHLQDYIRDFHLKVLEKYDDGNSLLIKVKI